MNTSHLPSLLDQMLTHPERWPEHIRSRLAGMLDRAGVSATLSAATLESEDPGSYLATMFRENSVSEHAKADALRLTLFSHPHTPGWTDSPRAYDGTCGRQS